MKRKLTALLTAGMMMMAALPPVQASEDDPSMESVIGTLPDWTPMDFADALQFYNTYGSSHVEDNFICLVRPKACSRQDSYLTELSGSMTLLNTPACTSPAVFSLEIPAQPDPDDAQAVEAYEAYCDRLGLGSYDYNFFSAYTECSAQYVFEVQLFRVLEGEDLTVTWSETNGSKVWTTKVFRFENESGFTEQTDLYRWAPDCRVEYDAFLANNGRACVYDNYIVHCANVNASTGASLTVEQSGEGAAEQVLESTCGNFQLRNLVEPVCGNTTYSVIVYAPTADGLLDITWTVGRTWSEEPPFEVLCGRYHIQNDCTEITDLTDGFTVFTFVDRATGMMIDMPEDAGFTKKTIQEDYCAELFAIPSNPCIIDSMTVYDPHCSYSFDIRTADGYYEAPEFVVASEESDSMMVICYLSYQTNPEPVLPDGATRITLYDKDTGELIPDEVIRLHNFTFGTSIGIEDPSVPGGMMYTGPFYTIDSNHFVLENDQLAHYYKYADSFSFTTGDEPEVTYYCNESMDLIFRIKIEVSGDLNGDDAFSLIDAVAFQKWLLGSDQVEIYYLAEGDLDLNGKLNAFDLAIMKRKLFAQ